jgi:hypothetical protein
VILQKSVIRPVLITDFFWFIYAGFEEIPLSKVEKCLLEEGRLFKIEEIKRNEKKGRP